MDAEPSVTDGPLDLTVRVVTLQDDPQSIDWLHATVSLFPGLVIAVDTEDLDDHGNVDVVLAGHGAQWTRQEYIDLLTDVLDCLTTGEPVEIDQPEGEPSDD